MERDVAQHCCYESAGVTSMTNGISIAYGDIAPEAKENFSASASETAFGDKYKDNLQQYNMQIYNYGNPCELYQTVLDGTAIPIPNDVENANLGLWSNQITSSDGTFQTPIVLTLTSEGQYSSQGFTLTFDKANGIYANSLKIEWYRVTDGAETKIHEQTYTPTSAFYFCRYKAENFNKVVITFYSLNMPENRLKLYSIDYGYGTVFYGDELRNVRITQQIDPISSEIAINTCDFTIDSKSDMEYSFQSKQPLTIRFNDELISTSFVKSSKRSGRFLWDINAEDYIGILENTIYVGGMYKDETAYNLFKDIFEVAKVPYSVLDKFKQVLVTGHIPYTTCREALMQVAFASMAVVDTSNSDVIKVYELSDTLTQTIPLSRIMQGQSFSDSDTVTSVELTSHDFRPTIEETEVYKAADSGTGTNILVKFSEPLKDLSISNGSFVKDENGNDLKNCNYAIINANTNCVLRGEKYYHNTYIHRKTNEKVLASETENVLTITDATLVSPSNIDNVLEKCYNWLIRTNSTNLRIIEGKNVTYGKSIKWGDLKWGNFKWGGSTPNVITYDKVVKVGDKISAETEYLGTVTGTVIKETYGLNGNILVKEAVLK